MFNFFKRKEDDKPKEITIGNRDCRWNKEKCHECIHGGKTIQECVDMRCIESLPHSVDRFEPKAHLSGGDINDLCLCAARGLALPYENSEGNRKRTIKLIESNLDSLSLSSLTEIRDFINKFAYRAWDGDYSDLVKKIDAKLQEKNIWRK